MSDDQIVLNISQNLQRIMGERKINQVELAKRTHTPIMSVSRTVNGRNMPKIGMICRFADVLEISVDELLRPAHKKTRRTA